ncbi:MAG: aminoacetone oxidase family FAD-binding enzyme [Candidatus Taylorbacteria bacterium]|nr:aminoacetone oxidase family FAD-binding enzyme [Candidatus Taylorbacteria bacterium]
MEKGSQKIWDVAVIGGGPAGMMSAGRAAELGARVILIEKNDTLGKKLLITGGGRCNVTNAELDVRIFLSKFKGSDKFLFSSFSKWGVKETLDFFHSRKMETKIEAEKRAFPKSEKAQSVWDVLVDYLKVGKVTVQSNSPVTEILADKSTITGVRLANGESIRARSVIIATGGKSRPETGSTGDGFVWLKKLGHKVTEPDSALVPIAIKDVWVKRLQGVSLQNIKLTSFQNGVKQEMRKGKILFTHFGVSGPTVINMSKDAGELLKYGEVVLSLDLLPELDYGMLNAKLQEIFKTEHTKKFKNSLKSLVPSALSPVIVELSGISADTKCNSITREERLKLVKLLKDIPMKVKGLLGADKAIVTSGGVALDEVDFKTMRSRLSPNLFLVGDILDIDRPSGGYSLQLCWTTGFVAGTESAKKN